MRNLEIAALFYKAADIYEMLGVEWKPRAYRRAAKAIETLSEECTDLYAKSGIEALKRIPGVGEALARHIVELLQKGTFEEFEELKKKLPPGLDEVMEVPGVGPKRAMQLHKTLGIKSVAELEAAARAHKIATLAGFGAKSEENILKGIELLKRGRGRMLLGHALPIAQRIVEHLKRAVPQIRAIEPAGSLRRRAETIGDIDVLVAIDKPMLAPRIMDSFVTMPDVAQVLAKGSTKSTVILRSGVQADVRVLEEKSFGSALQYFTGSKDHNIQLRTLAIKKGYKLSEYGLFDARGRQIAGRSEEEVYRALGLRWIPPELREALGEISAAARDALPKLVDYTEVRGDWHVHTKWSDGDDSIEEIANEALKRGYEWICIADHSKSEHVARGLTEERLLKQVEEIKALNAKLRRAKKRFRILAGNEVDILANGELDYSDDVLKRLDIVQVAVHRGFKMPRDAMTQRLLTALTNRYVRILCHPTGRLIGERAPYEADFEKIFEECALRKVALEINAFPDRLDLNGAMAKAAIEAGAKLAIGTDAHNKEQLRYIELGVATARRGWATSQHVLNTLNLKGVEKFLGI